MGKKWTEEERKAFGEKMKAAKAAKEAERNALKQPEEPATIADEPAKTETVVSGQDDTNAILARALEAIETLAKLQANSAGGQQGGAQLSQGRVVGVIEKYSLSPEDYPSPVERLANEPKLARFAFPLNYELEYSVTSTQYETKAGITYTEPQFNLQLNKIILDEITGEPTAGRYKISGLVMFEDPVTAVTVARQNGINVDDYDEKQFLNEMRYIQMRDWLFEQFFKIPNIQKKRNKREMVINGKVVEYFEINGENVSPIPFGELGSMLK